VLKNNVRTLRPGRGGTSSIDSVSVKITAAAWGPSEVLN
jgi:hypothetical protein